MYITFFTAKFYSQKKKWDYLFFRRANAPSPITTPKNPRGVCVGVGGIGAAVSVGAGGLVGSAVGSVGTADGYVII